MANAQKKTMNLIEISNITKIQPKNLFKIVKNKNNPKTHSHPHSEPIKVKFIIRL